MWMHPHTIKLMETNTNDTEAKQPAGAGCHPTACSPSDTPETDAEWKRLQGFDGKYYVQTSLTTLAVGMSHKCKELERERFTIDEIADYIAGWTLGSFDEVAKLGAHVAHNALNQLRDQQDGIKAVRLRKLHRDNPQI